MDKLTCKIRIPVNADQLTDVIGAAEKTGLRIVDVCRFAFVSFLQNPTSERYAMIDGALDRGERVATIQVPITPTMELRLEDAVYCAGISGYTAVELGRIAIINFSRHHNR